MAVQNIINISFLFSFLLTFPGENFVKPGEIWLDTNSEVINAHGGGILYEHGTYYWFGEHKTSGEEGNLANVGVHCYSSKDLYHWKNEGVVLAVDPKNSGSDIESGCILERPKVIKNEKTGKYVMWFHLEPKGKGYKGAMSGVAVSDKATGPYKFIKAFRPDAGYWPINVLSTHKTKPYSSGSFDGGSLPNHPDSLNILGRDFKNGQMARDMTLFVDDNGKAYLVYASEENSTLHISELTPDYLSYSGRYKRCFVNRFMEAPALFKRNGKYYLMMSGCTGWAPNAARSAVADSVFGEWKELGNPCTGPDAETTFHSQSTYIMQVQGLKDTYIYMGDRWNPKNAVDGRYIWLPVTFKGDSFHIKWMDTWNLNLINI